MQNEAKLLWASATVNDIEQYRNNIDTLLDQIVLDPEVLYCNDYKCNVHYNAIQLLHDDIINCCLNVYPQRKL